MSAFNHFAIGPWPRGMTRNVVRDTALPEGTLYDALNVNIRPDGTFRSRHTWQNVLAGDGRDLYEHSDGRVYGIFDGAVVEFEQDSLVEIMPGVDRASWTDLNGKAVFATREGVFEIDDLAVTQLTATRDEQDVDDVLLDLPGGQWVDYWNGRLVLARGARLIFSEPLRYGAYNPHIGFIDLPRKIQWVAPLETGIFVGLKDHVLFLRGRSPSDIQITRVARESAPGMALVVPGELINAGEGMPGRVAVFFTRAGFTLGLPDGTVGYPQGALLRDLPLFRGKLVRTDHRIFAVRGD